ncbi:sugar ABC transporter permease [Cohnella faecalis]|uniref:Sugar ABC transporter permease n=1 Tax=Cohnella faecalis TaxID=2315694 RepID=A0A398CMI4_9BACL|nr:sugar ABC transporter permease [Cohnella faecalis]RIE01107.1 sugar ABC transporter permease [Cohnella faecalis]
MKKSGYTSKTTRLFIYLLLGAVAVSSLYPILWIVLSSLSPGSTLYSASLIPDRVTFVHYKTLFLDSPFTLWYWNTLKIALMTMTLSVLLIVLGAYSFSQFRFKGRQFFLTTMLVLQIFPPFMTMIAVFLLLYQVNLLDSHLGMVLVYTGVAIPYGTWLMKGYMDGIPRSVPEAAKIDGASHFVIFARIMLPMTTPALIFISLTNFTAPWMDFILARLVLHSADKKTLALGLFDMVKDKAASEFTTFAAGSVMVAIPIALLYLYLQKYIVNGVTEGASKA